MTKPDRVFVIPSVLAVCALILLPVVAAIRATPKVPAVWDNAEPTVAPQGLLKSPPRGGDFPKCDGPCDFFSCPIYDVNFSKNPVHRYPELILYTVNGKDLAGPQHERGGNFWTGQNTWLLEEADYAGSGYDIGHLRAWMLSAGNPDWRQCNWMGACVPMHETLNRGMFAKWERHVANLVREHGSADVEIRIDSRCCERFPNSDEDHGIPTAFTCRVTAGGVTKTWQFPNDASVHGKDLAEFEVVE